MNNLENSFREALTDFDQVSPSEGLWSKITTSLLLKSTGFKVSIYTLLTLLLFGLPSYFIFMPSNDAIIEKQISSHSEITTNPISNSATNESNAAEKAITNTSLNNSTKDNSIAEKTKTVKQDIKTNEVKAETTHNITSATIKEDQKAEAIKTQELTHKKPNSNSSMIASSTIITAVNTSEENSASKQDITNEKKPITGQSIATTTEGRNLATKNEVKISHTSNNESRKEIPKMPNINELTFKQELSANLSQFNYKINSKQKMLYHDALEVFAGPNIAFSQIYTSNNSLQSGIDLRRSSESPKLSYHFGANYKSYYNKWFVGLGINYHRIDDRASYLMPAFDVDSALSSYMIFSTSYNHVITGYIKNPNDTNSQIPIYSVVKQQDTTLVNQMHYDSLQTMKTMNYTNSYSFIEIPLTIGREFSYKHFVIDIAGGVSWNRLVNTRVSIPNETGTAMLDNQQLENIIVKNTFNGIFALGVAYRMNEGSLLFIRPELRYNLNSLFEKSYPINQKYIQLRLSLGMRIKL